ncbi:predicted ORF [Xanthomonas phage XacN1]|nr:predicted ORF [Xanthomonas phage XacN1]BBA65705.1 predicted ORF [Xanthomonas phage XacN1]
MPKYLLIDSTSVFIPGDERSRTNPGHGYPERTETYPVLKWFDTEQQVLEYLETWGRNIKDPQIWELAGKVKLEVKTTLSLSK